MHSGQAELVIVGSLEVLAGRPAAQCSPPRWKELNFRTTSYSPARALLPELQIQLSEHISLGKWFRYRAPFQVAQMRRASICNATTRCVAARRRQSLPSIAPTLYGASLVFRT